MLSTEKNKIIISLVSSVIVLFGIAYLLYREPVKKVEKADEKKSEEKVERVKIELEVFDGKSSQIYPVKVDVGSSMLDMLENLRKKGTITYDTTSYLSGEVVDTINGVTNKGSENLVWSLYINEELTSQSFREVKIEKNSTYKWIYGVKK